MLDTVTGTELLADTDADAVQVVEMPMANARATVGEANALQGTPRSQAPIPLIPVSQPA